MKRFCLFCLCLLCLSVWGASAQVVEKVLDIFGADSLSNSKVAVTADSDSVHLSTVKKELAAARLNEANLRMEIEQMKLAAYTADSVKLASQRRRIYLYGDIHLFSSFLFLHIPMSLYHIHRIIA